MKNFLKNIPLPICGLILALVSLGNLLKTESMPIFGSIIGLIGMILMSFVLFKIMFTFKHTLANLQNPIVASVAPTFTMSCMVICTYFLHFESIKPLLSWLWLGIVCLHFILMFYFTYNFLVVKSVRIQDIYPSWFITFVGIGVITITSINFYPEFGRWIFWLTLALYLILLPIILYRVFRVKNMEDATMPLITIIAAPGSLCLTGYLNAFDDKNILIVTLLFALSQGLYFIILSQLPKLLAVDFYPSYAGFTFPLVISATAITATTNFYHQLGISSALFHWLAILESIIAFIIVFYVLYKYVMFLSQQYFNARVNSL
ncbi:TDT family transporter [Lysinibacillus sp. NPDC097195]|uniref:TDT family transporter n=1 Tax=Lysinibacillus sp. NPDC097195 TaxID=3364141 RepID=UPI0037FD0F9A